MQNLWRCRCHRVEDLKLPKLRPCAWPCLEPATSRIIGGYSTNWAVGAVSPVAWIFFPCHMSHGCPLLSHLTSSTVFTFSVFWKSGNVCPLLCLKKRRHTHMNILIRLLGFGDKFTRSPKANSCFTEGRCERTWDGGKNGSKCSKIGKRKLVEIILLNVMLELILTTDVVSLLGYQKQLP